MLGARHAAERSLRCWGAGAGLSFDATRTAIRNLLEVLGPDFTARFHMYGARF